MSVITHWRSLSRRERWTWPLVLLCTLLGFGVFPLLGELSPRVAAFAGWERQDRDWGISDKTEDPWGNPWGWGILMERDGFMITDVPYSWGPNGKDESGQGDDVLVFADMLRSFARGEAELTARFDEHFGDKYVLPDPPYPATFLVAWSRELFLAVAMLLVWSVRAPCLRSERSAQLWKEGLRALVIASLPGVLGAKTVLWLQEHYFWLVPSTEGSLLQVPLGVAVIGAWALLCFLIALALRLRRPLPEVGEEST